MNAEIWPENAFVRWWKEPRAPKQPLVEALSQIEITDDASVTTGQA